MGSGGAEGGDTGKVDTDGVLNAFDNALDEWFAHDPGAGKYARPMPGGMSKKVKHGCCPGCGTPFQVRCRPCVNRTPLESSKGQSIWSGLKFEECKCLGVGANS